MGLEYRSYFKILSIHKPSVGHVRSHKLFGPIGCKQTEKNPNEVYIIDDINIFNKHIFVFIRYIQFMQIHPKLQSMLKKDVQRIHESADVISSADKARNKVKVFVKQYIKLVVDNIKLVFKKQEICSRYLSNNTTSW